MQGFSAKRSALFACLDDASKELKGTTLDQADAKNPFKRRSVDTAIVPRRGLNSEMVYRASSGGDGVVDIITDRSLSRMRGKESIFKKPELPISKCLKPRKMPDYQINPHKWKKYSLSDVDISDHTNTAAALAFLRQIDEQRSDDEAQNEDSADEKKIEFKKCSKIKRNLKAIEALEVPDAEVDKPKLKGSKLVMPEYVIGQRKHERSKRLGTSEEVAGRQKKERATGTLKLSHLQVDDGDEEETT